MSEYTPEPWEARDSGDGYGPVQVFSGDKEIADCSGGWQELGKEQCNANTRLVAAAPDLIQACRELVDNAGVMIWAHITNGPCSCKQCAISRARAAIAKATGETEKKR